MQDKKTAPRTTGPGHIMSNILKQLQEMHSTKGGVHIDACITPGELSDYTYLPLPKSGTIMAAKTKEYFPKKIWMDSMECASVHQTKKNSPYEGFYQPDTAGNNFRQMHLYRKWVLNEMITNGGLFGVGLIDCIPEPGKKGHEDDKTYLESLILDGLLERRQGTFYQATPNTRYTRYPAEPTMFTLLITNFVCDLVGVTLVDKFLRDGNNYHPAVERAHGVVEGIDILEHTYFVKTDKNSLALDSTHIEQCLIEPQSILMKHLLDYLRHDPDNHFSITTGRSTARKDGKPPAKKKQKTGHDVNDNFVWKNLKNRAGYLIGREVLAMVHFGGGVVKPSAFTGIFLPLFNEKLLEKTLLIKKPIGTNWALIADLIGRFILFSDCWKLVKETHTSWGLNPKTKDKKKPSVDWRNNNDGTKSELLFEPTNKMTGFPSIEQITEPLTISQIFQLVLSGKMFKDVQQSTPFFDITSSIESNGMIMSELNNMFQKALDWQTPGSTKVNSTIPVGTDPHLGSLVTEMVKISKKYLAQGTLKTTKQCETAKLALPKKVENEPTLIERNDVSSRLLEMSELFSSMEKWATLNYAILKNSDCVAEYKLEHFAEVPIFQSGDRNLFLCDVSTHQVQKDILTMKELVKSMQVGEQMNACKVDGNLPIAAVLECARKPTAKLHLGSGEKGVDLVNFEKALFEKADLKKMTKEDFDVELKKE